ncbi:6-bladed beta-propeller [Petrimonas sp.]|uniref:6-bladed beta-propeller n=1 Tax=Petrimonas sp. TaxID=2023866 RepID=UPI003F50F34A
MKYIFLIISLFILISCTNNEDSSKSIIKISHNENSNFDIKIDRILKIPINDSCFIGDITQILKTKNNIILVDANKMPSVYIIDLDQNSIRELSVKGSGPKEYIHPVFAVIDSSEKTLNVLDIGKNSILKYNINDDFLFIDEKKIPFNTNQFHYLNDNKIIWNNTDYDKGMELSKFKVIITDSLYSIKIKDLKKEFHNGYSFDSFKRKFYNHNNQTCFYFPFIPTLYTFNNNSINEKYQFMIEGFEFPSSNFLKRIGSDNQNYIPVLFESPYIFTFEIFENETHFLISFFKQNNYYAIYNKQTKESKIFTSSEFQRIINIPFLSPPISVIDNNFVSIIYDINDIKENIDTIVNNELNKIIINSRVDDNPILIFYTFE